MSLFLDPAPLLAAARNGRPHHQRTACPYCHGRTGNHPGVFTTPDHTGKQRHPGWSALCVTDHDLAARLDTSPRQIQRWRHGVRIRANDLDTIDRMAIAVGSHPLVLWPELDPTWGQVAA